MSAREYEELVEAGAKALTEKVAKAIRDAGCPNCDGRKCMGCVFREYDHDCADDCPDCCDPNSKFYRDSFHVAEAAWSAVADDLRAEGARRVVEKVEAECSNAEDQADWKDEDGDTWVEVNVIREAARAALAEVERGAE